MRTDDRRPQCVGIEDVNDCRLYAQCLEVMR
jgi:hypothetical protein